VYILLFVESPAPSICVCTSLRMATRVVTRHYDRALAPVGLSTSAYSILSRIDREGPKPLGALASRLAMDRTTLSRELTPLVDDGLVEALPDPEDRRRRIVALTDRGSSLVAEARPLWAAAQKALEEDFGGARTEKLMRELHALVGAA
jgi:DNA-binding MarR family transcriptional regulator